MEYYPVIIKAREALYKPLYIFYLYIALYIQITKIHRVK